MGIDETFFFGALAVCFAAFALYLFGEKKWGPGAACALAVLGLTALAAYGWHRALVESGKNPAWLGVYHHPAPLCIVGALAAFGVGCLAVALRQHWKNSRYKKKALSQHHS